MGTVQIFPHVFSENKLHQYLGVRGPSSRFKKRNNPNKPYKEQLKPFTQEKRICWVFWNWNIVSSYTYFSRMLLPFQEVSNRIPMQICKSSMRMHQHVSETLYLLEIFQISHHQPEDWNRSDAHGPCAAERVTLWFSPHSLWGVSQSVGWWQCESGPLPLPIPHVKTVNVSFGFDASVTIEAWALRERIAPVLQMRYRKHFSKNYSKINQWKDVKLKLPI